MTEKCGVVGVSLDGRDAARPLYYALYALQHRGQESAGIVTHDGFQQHSHVEMGLVGDAFGEDDLDALNGSAGIGHVRYPTAGSVDSSCAQPFSVSFKSGSLGLSHNGNLVNADEIRDELAAAGHAFTSDGDTEVIAHDLARNLLEEDLVRAVKRTMGRVHGSYSLTITHDDTVLGVRDPQGNRPLCIGELEDGYILASESAAIDTLDGELVRDVRPGELVVLQGGRRRLRLLPARRTGEYRPLLFRTRLLRAPRQRHRRHARLRGPPQSRPEALVGKRRRDRCRDACPRLRAGLCPGYADAASETTADGEPRAADDDGVEFAEGLMKIATTSVGRSSCRPRTSASARGAAQAQPD